MKLAEHPTWHGSAPCHDHLGLFYPPKGAGADLAYAVARTICARCPFIVECRAEGDLLEVGEFSLHGLRAGELPHERRRRRRQARKAVPQAVVAVNDLVRYHQASSR